MSEDVDRILSVISHKVRRDIIVSIAEKGPRSFTELMEDTGVKDTGTLTFHLRKMAGLLRKNERGDYELTDLGRRAYEIIKVAYGLSSTAESKVGERVVESRGEVESRVREVPEGEELEPSVIHMGDAIEIVIDRELLESVKAQGKKLLVRDVIMVDVADDVDERLFSEVIEGIRDVVSLRVPRHLRGLAQIKSRDVLSISVKGEGGGLIPGLGDFMVSLVDNIVNSVTSTVSSIIGPLSKLSNITLGVREAKRILYEDSFEDVRSLSLDLASGYFKVNSGDVEKAHVKIEGTGGCRYDVDVDEGILEVEASGCQVTVELPRTPLNEVEVNIEGGALEMELEGGVNSLNSNITGGLANMRLAGVKSGRLNLDIEGGHAKINVEYVEFEGTSDLKLTLTGGLAELLVLAPEGTRVEVSSFKTGGLHSIDVDERLRDVKTAKAIVKAKLEVTGGMLRADFKGKS